MDDPAGAGIIFTNSEDDMNTPTMKRRSSPDPLDELDAEDLVFELKCAVMAADRDTHGSAYDVKVVTEEAVDRLDRLQRVEEENERMRELLEEFRPRLDQMAENSEDRVARLVAHRGMEKIDTLLDDLESTAEAHA